MNDRVLVAAGAAAPLVVVALAFFVAPDAEGFAPGPLQRVFYFHVPAAWVGYLAFAVTAVASARHLASRDAEHDRLAAASAEVGLVFSAIALATGLLWADVEFGGAYDPLADAKVVSLVVVILAYLAYVTLRAGVEDRARRGRLAAVFGVLAAATVPVSYLATKVSVHPDFTRPEQSLAPELGMVLGVSVAMFTLLYVAMLRVRLAIGRAEDAIADARAAGVA